MVRTKNGSRRDILVNTRTGGNSAASLMMMAWVNLHLGLTAGLGLIAGYVLLECLEMVWLNHRRSAIDHLRRAWPWFLATVGAMLVNPWGWRMFAASLHLMAPMTARSQQILEWMPTKLNWRIFVFGLSLRNPDTFVVLLLVVAIAVPVALIRRQLGAAVWLCGAALLGIRSQRLQVLFSIVVVIVAGSVFAEHQFRPPTPPAFAAQDKVVLNGRRATCKKNRACALILRAQIQKLFSCGMFPCLPCVFGTSRLVIQIG